MQNEAVTREERQKRNTPLFVLKIVGNVIFYLIILALLLFSIMNINAGNRQEGFPNIFGKGMLSVQSNSMKGDNEDSFVAGDLIYVNVFHEEDFDKLEVGQVITFYDRSINALNSHRIVYIKRESSGEINNIALQGDYSVKNDGRYNPDDSSLTVSNKVLLDEGRVQIIGRSNISDIKGVMTGVWRGAGKTLDFMQEYWLFIFVIPVVIFLAFELFMVGKNVLALKNEKEKQKNAIANEEALEAQKAELRAQILAELEAEANGDFTAKPNEELKEAPVQESEPHEEPLVVDTLDSKSQEEEEQAAKEEKPAVEPVKKATSRSTTTKKSTSGAKKSTSTGKNSNSTTKKSTSGTKKSASTGKNSNSTTKKSTSGTKKSASTTKKTNTKAEDTEKGE